ncbi:thioredoxin family protein [Paenibacillus sp. GCM10012306]|uniref:thioredoxin family protein n=1 Tax=Paenibacillus sp. GCM10012306 TaxID=3317342 RepID=UPI00360D2B63
MMQEMKEPELLKALEVPGDPLIVFLHTPLCGTCKVARRMLEVAGHLVRDDLVIHEANVNMLPELVRSYRISSVPALLVAQADRLTPPEVHYSMGSVERVLEYIRRGITP